jgi:hypothetical protein
MKKLLAVLTISMLMSYVGIAQAINVMNQTVAINANTPSIVPFTISVSGASSQWKECSSGNMGCWLLTGNTGGSIYLNGGPVDPFANTCSFASSLKVADFSIDNNNIILSAAAAKLPVTSFQTCQTNPPPGGCPTQPPVTCPSNVKVNLSGNAANGYTLTFSQ